MDDGECLSFLYANENDGRRQGWKACQMINFHYFLLYMCFFSTPKKKSNQCFRMMINIWRSLSLSKYIYSWFDGMVKWEVCGYTALCPFNVWKEAGLKKKLGRIKLFKGCDNFVPLMFQWFRSEPRWVAARITNNPYSPPFSNPLPCEPHSL